jgi:hypothetical protein
MNKQPPLYYRTKEQIAAYRAMPVEQKIRKMEMEMELLYYIRLARSRPDGEAGSIG